MSDLIKRSDAIKTIWGDGINPSEDGMVFEAQSHIDRDIRLIPSADRPRGEWIRTGRTNIYGGIEVQCSNCGDRVMVQHLEDEWYCRHCGARMKGADDES